jgi:hypothetical protein
VHVHTYPKIAWSPRRWRADLPGTGRVVARYNFEDVVGATAVFADDAAE